jgi:hypothetical protein
MIMKKTALMFGLLTVFSILFISFASAALVLSSTNVPSSVTHDQGNIQILFTLENTGNNAETGLVWTGTTNIGTWSSVPTINSVTSGSKVPLSAVLTIPKNSVGTINANLNVKSTSNQQGNLPVTIQILSTASISVTNVQDFTGIDNSGKVKVLNDGNVNLNSIELTGSGAFDVTFSDPSFALAPGGMKTVTATPVQLSNLKFGSNSVSIVARDNGQGVEDSASLVHSKSFCKAGSVGGNLSITNVDIQSDGDDDEEWKLLDTIDVEVDVDNDGNDDIDDVEVHLGFFDSQGRNQANDLDFENSDEEKIRLGDLNDGDDDTVTFTFRVPADFDTGDYKLAIKAFSDKLGESKECTDSSSDLSDDIFQNIDVNQEDDEGKFIAFDNIEIRPTEEVTCGDTVTINMDVINIGDEDQEQVRVNLESTELGLDLDREIRQDLDEGDKEEISFTFIVPNGLADKLYTLRLSADYDYRRGSYRESSDDSTDFGLRVIGCSLSPGGGQPTDGRIAFIGAALDSDAKAGQELLVRATVTNLLPGQADFVVRAAGFESWASVNSISKRLVTLGNGESAEVVISFNVNKGVSGEQSFIIEALSGDQLERREVAVTIEDSSGGAGIDLGDNSLIWVIGIINVILIILIIVVAARISKR